MAVAGLVWLSSALVLGRSDADRPFSTDELAALRSGQLVKREAREERGTLQLMGGSSWQLIDAPPDAVFRALADTTKYTRMLPAVTASKLLTEEEGARVIRLEHKRGPIGLSYDVRAQFYPDRRDVTFRLQDAPGGAPRAAWGFFSVRPYGQRYTLLAYGVMADPGDGIVVGILRSVVHEWMLQVPRQVKKFVESAEGRSRYH
jgi:carbon monoxide dehydrogenase subunit G